MVLTLKELTQISNHDSVSNVCPNFLNVESSKKIKKYSLATNSLNRVRETVILKQIEGGTALHITNKVKL